MQPPGPWNAPPGQAPGYGPPMHGYGPPQAGASQQAIIALVLAIAGWLACGCLTSIPAIFVARAELKAIDAGLSPAAGRSLAQVAFWLGLVNMILYGLVVVLYAVFALLGVAIFAAGV
jgi:hypothetical protein